MKILFVCGEHNYGVRLSGLGYEYRTFLPALRRLGHVVEHLESWNIRRYGSFEELNRSCLRRILEFQPDVVIAVPILYEVWMDLWELVTTRTPAVTVRWACDDSWRFEESSRFQARSFDLPVTTYPHIAGRYRRAGMREVFVSQWACADDEVIEPRLARACECGAIFVGQATPFRRRMFSALEKRGLSVQTFGQGWPGGAVRGEDIGSLYNSARVCVNFSEGARRAGKDGRGAQQIKARVFEAAGAGTVVLTEYAPGLEEYFELDREVLVFRTIEELGEKLRDVLSNDTQRDKIAHRGFRRVQREHLYSTRFARLLAASERLARTKSVQRWDDVSGPELESELERAIPRGFFDRALRFGGRTTVAVAESLLGERRGRRVVRRLTFELSRRLQGEKSFGARGWSYRLVSGSLSE